MITAENTVLARGVFVRASSDSIHGGVVRGLSGSLMFIKLINSKLFFTHPFKVHAIVNLPANVLRTVG